MDHYNRQDKEFLDGVWAKARYLEYVKHEQEQIRVSQKKMAAARFRIAIMLMVTVITLSVPMVLLGGLDIGSIIGVGILILGAGTYFEYLAEKQMDRRTTHGNKY